MQICSRCGGRNQLNDQFCKYCGLNLTYFTASLPADIELPRWWRKKRVWVVMLSGWVVAFVLFVALLASSVNDVTDPESVVAEGVQAASTCEEVFLWQFYALETGDFSMMLEATNRATQLGCQ